MYKEAFSAVAIVLTFLLFAGYIRLILAGSIKPHVFSWIIWAVSTLTVFFAQLAGNAGVGAWPIGISGLITFSIAILSYVKRGDTQVTRTDWAFLVAALSAIPAWYLTSDPLWAVVILTLADVIGFGPTLRRAYNQPHLESGSFYALGALRNGLVIVALEHYSMTTALFPVAVGAGCLVVAAVIVIRKRTLSTSAAPASIDGAS
jgi:hypothetical protein